MRTQGLRLRMSRINGVTPRGILSQPYIFQCPPLDDFSHTRAFNRGRYSALAGEFSRRGGRQLISVPFRTVLVEWGQFVLNESFDVQDHIARITAIADQGFPFYFLATHPYNDEPELDIMATLDSITITENAGEPDARYLDLTISEWRDPVVQRLQQGKAKKKRKGKRDLPFTVTLHKDGTYSGLRSKGEPLTLSLIARYGYGNSTWGKYIARANGLTDWGWNTPLIEHPRLRTRGGKIKVPDLPPVSNETPTVVGTSAQKRS